MQAIVHTRALADRATQNVKIVVVGDETVGKTCFVISWSTDTFPRDYVPKVYENYIRNVTVDKKLTGVALWDTAGQGDYDQFRPLVYPDTDIVLVCFSVDSPSSLANIKTKWVPEVKHHCPDTPFMLVGMKRDLRKSTVTAESSDTTHQFVDITAAHQLAKETGAVGYYETSALTGEGVSDAIEAAIRVVNNRLSQKKFTWPWKKKSRVPQEFLTNVSESRQAEASGGLTEDSKVSDREDKCKEDSKKDDACGGKS